MPCSVLIRATTSPSGGMPIGAISVVMQGLPINWGSSEGLPNWIHVNISDADASEVEFFLAQWITRFEVTTVQDIPARARLRFEVHPSVISSSGTGRDEIKAEMSAWVLAFYGGSIVNNSVSHILADFPKADPRYTSIPEITSDFADIFNTLFDRTRYYVSESDVNTVVSEPHNGEITITKAEALATVNDKFLD